MQCDVCGEKDATVFLTQIVEGKMQKVNLCESCSKAKGVNDPTGFALADLLLGLGAAQDIEKGATPAKCPVCGFTQADFKKTGRLGCSECYTTFADGLSGMLANMHKGTVHVGKAPGNRAQKRELIAKVKSLQTNLDEAVAHEQYEEAANLRDEIRRIETEIMS
ncbi:MAG TPA: UvrB/UvrC motif-containing protein [Chthoniobacterales bacterium]|nr:UvrB/UvrC motif-containing protein [Chthoniobacterales bacterium]